jgi:dTDP-4-amino-4,6-dideoxygalactose transaminase
MDGLQGGFLSVKLKYLDTWNERRQRAAAKYDEVLSGSALVLPTKMPYARHVYHLYVVQVEDRDRLRNRLAAGGIETGIHYPTPIHLQQAYSGLRYQTGSFPVTEYLSSRILSLPMYPDLTDEKIEHVASVLLESLQCSTLNQEQIAA